MPGKGPKGHRLKRSELKEDHFVTEVMRAVHFVDRRRREVVGAVVGLAVIVGGVLVVRARMRGREAEAAQLLATAEIALAQGRADEAMAGYRHLADSFDGTRAGREAGVYLGQLLLEQGDTDGAAHAFQAAADKAPSWLVRAAAEAGLAACLEESGDVEAAAAAYEDLAARYKGTHMAPEMLVRAGHARQRNEQWQDAERLFLMVIETYPESSLIPTARFELGYSRTRSEEEGA